MSRKKVKIKGAAPEKVTAPVTEPSLAEKKAAFTVIEKDVFEAMDAARDVGAIIGKLQGYELGATAPRTAGEQRAREQRPRAAGILQEVFREIQKAITAHGPMRTGHEGYAVILEELDELWDEIKANRGRQVSARKEAIQVAAMAVRYVLDLDPH